MIHPTPGTWVYVDDLGQVHASRNGEAVILADMKLDHRYVRLAEMHANGYLMAGAYRLHAALSVVLMQQIHKANGHVLNPADVEAAWTEAHAAIVAASAP